MCLGCVGRKTAGQAGCPDSGIELMCPYGDTDDKYAIGCTKPNDEYKTVEEWCKVKYEGKESEINNCKITVKGDENQDPVMTMSEWERLVCIMMVLKAMKNIRPLV